MIDVETYAAAKAYTDAHGGEGGTTNYSALDNKPQINAVELSGNKTAEDLGLVAAVEGKGLSTNDYSDTEKGKVADNTSAIEAIMNEYGAKNLLPNNATSQTIAGVTFTVNADGSVTADGTATTDTRLYMIDGFDVPEMLYGKELIMNGCYGGAPNVYRIWLGSDKWQQVSACVNGDGKKFIISRDVTKLKCMIQIYEGQTVSNVTFYPMIRDARITDPTYVPYAMTNRELTEKIDRGSVSVIADGVKTYSQILNELYSLIDLSKITKDSCLYSIGAWGYVNYKPDNISEGKYVFTSARVSVFTGIYIESAEITQNDSVFALYYNGNIDDRSSTVSQASYTLYY